MIRILCIWGRELFHFTPVVLTAGVSAVYIGCSALASSTIFVLRSDNNEITVNGHRPAKPVISFCIWGCKFFHLAPIVLPTIVTLVNVSCPAVSASSIFSICSNHNIITTHANRCTKHILIRCIRGKPFPQFFRYSGGQLAHLIR